MNIKQLTRFLSLALVCALGLTACDGAKRELGLTRKAPDEFAVVKRAPLEMPPDYTLRPPRPGAARPQEAMPEEQARTVIFGDEQMAKTAPDNAESALLQKAGSGNAQSGIRDVVDYETSKLAPKDKPVAEKLLGWGSSNDAGAATVVDAQGEAERLRKNVKEGKPLTEGETPTKEE